MSPLLRLGEVPEIDLEGLLQRYELLLLDALGVLADISGALPGAAAALERIEASGRRFLVVTNDSSTLPENHALRYQGYGLPVRAEQMVTSGSLLVEHFRDQGLVGARCAVLGPDDSKVYVERAGGRVVEPSWEGHFDVLVICDQKGYDFVPTLDRVLSGVLRRAREGSPLHLVVPNPDLLYPRGAERVGLTSGSIAGLLEAALAQRLGSDPRWRFHRLGKPHPFLFQVALSRVASSGPSVMLGDQLDTDVRGAQAAGLDAVLLGSGLTRLQPDTPLRETVPTWWMEALRP